MLHIEDCPGRQISEDYMVTQKGGRDEWLQFFPDKYFLSEEPDSFGSD